jgi:hypothetical protein
MTPDGLGYVLHFDNTSVGNEKTVNEVRKVSIQPFPYKLVTGLYLAKPGVEQITKSAANAPANVFHPNPAIYKVKVSGQEKILALSQSFDSGWQAYKVKDGLPVFLAPFFGKKLKEHFLVNNWANGWRLDAGKDIEIVVVYLPQYLEFLGFGLFAILPLVLFWPQVFRLDRIVRVFKFRYNLG